jgi:hypothetical protein
MRTCIRIKNEFTHLPPANSEIDSEKMGYRYIYFKDRTTRFLLHYTLCK